MMVLKTTSALMASLLRVLKYFYAKAGHSADDRIKDMVRTASYSRDITVVSSDRELRSCVSSLGAKVI